MRKRIDIETDINNATRENEIVHLVTEILLDIRDSNQALLELAKMKRSSS